MLVYDGYGLRNSFRSRLPLTTDEPSLSKTRPAGDHKTNRTFPGGGGGGGKREMGGGGVEGGKRGPWGGERGGGGEGEKEVGEVGREMEREKGREA